MTRIDPYDVIAVEPERFVQSQAARRGRRSWLAKQLGITTDELSKRLNVSVADLDARLDRSARAKRRPTSDRLLWEPEPFDEMRSRPLGGDLSGGQNDHPKPPKRWPRSTASVTRPSAGTWQAGWLLDTPRLWQWGWRR